MAVRVQKINIKKINDPVKWMNERYDMIHRAKQQLEQIGLSITIKTIIVDKKKHHRFLNLHEEDEQVKK